MLIMEACLLFDGQGWGFKLDWGILASLLNAGPLQCRDSATFDSSRGLRRANGSAKMIYTEK